MNLIKALGLIGLMFNFVGTVLIIFYIRTDYKEHIQGEEGQRKGEKWYALYVKHPCWLFVGIIFIAIGFIFSLIAQII